MSLSNQILDFYDDSIHLYAKDVVGASPEFVKTASFMSREERNKSDRSLFALDILTKEGQHLSRYPIGTKADTWLSVQYFAKTAHKLPTTARIIAGGHIKEACQKFGLQIPSELQSFEKTASNLYVEMEKAKPQPVKIVDEDGDSYALNGMYPLFNEEHVKTASAYFGEFVNQFPNAHDRHTFAKNLQKRASALNVQLPQKEKNLLSKFASDCYGDLVGIQIKVRHEMVAHDQEKVAKLSKVAAAKEKVSPEQFAQLLYAFDKEAGIEPRYGKVVMDAFGTTFGTMFEKRASSGYSWSDETTGVDVNEAELVKAASDKFDKIKGYFGDTLADQLKKHAVAIFDSLPTDAKVVIAKIAKGTL